MFVPQSLSHDKVRDFLQTGYQLDDSYTEYVVGVEEGIMLHFDGNLICYTITSSIQGTTPIFSMTYTSTVSLLGLLPFSLPSSSCSDLLYIWYTD